MSVEERHKLSNDWANDLEQDINEDIRSTLDTYLEAKGKLDDLRLERDLRILRQAKIIGKLAVPQIVALAFCISPSETFSSTYWEGS